MLTQQPTLHCEATTESEPGEYPITVDGAEAQNYDISYVPGTLTIQSLHRVWLTIGVVGGGSAYYEAMEVANGLRSVEVSTTREVTIMLVAMVTASIWNGCAWARQTIRSTSLNVGVRNTC